MLQEHFFDNEPSEEEKRLFAVNRSAGAINVYFVKDISDGPGKVSVEATAFSLPSGGITLIGISLGNRAKDRTLAHELGHVLGVLLHHSNDDNLLMSDGAPGSSLTVEDVKIMRGSRFAK